MRLAIVLAIGLAGCSGDDPRMVERVAALEEQLAAAEADIAQRDAAGQFDVDFDDAVAAFEAQGVKFEPGIGPNPSAAGQLGIAHVIVWGESGGKPTAITIIGSLTNAEVSQATGRLIFVAVKLVLPSWNEDEAGTWFVDAIKAATETVSVFKTLDGVTATVVDAESLGIQTFAFKPERE